MNLREVIIQFNSRFDPRGLMALMGGINKAKDQATEFESSLNRVTQAIVAIGTASTLAFKQYEQSLTEFAGKAMNTADVFEAKFGKVSGKIARETGVMRREIFRGLQEGTSALLDPLDSAVVTKKAAILTAGNQARMANAMSVALSGYRNKFGKPGKVLDYVYSSAQLGQGQVAEFAPAWQYVLGFARGAGLELAEVASGIAAVSATAPSPLMGSTQFGAFLTGIARGSTYEQKLIDRTGTDSQGLRDMLRDQGLAKTAEFLASHFSGDELQQVFGRKEFVQFIQGTTGRKGILAKLEKLITENAEGGPIERFGKDLEKTLSNRFDRFIQAFKQTGAEYGSPLATASKVMLMAGQKLLESTISLNEFTGGWLSVLVTGAGAAAAGFALLNKNMRMFIFGLLGRATGLTNVFYNRYKNIGAAGMSAPKGGKIDAMDAAAAAMAAEAVAATAAHAAGASWGLGGDASAKAKASAAAAGPGAGAGVSASAASAYEQAAYEKAAYAKAAEAKAAQARAAADAAAGAAAGASGTASKVGDTGNKAQFDTGAKEWNEARREKQKAWFKFADKEAERDRKAWDQYRFKQAADNAYTNPNVGNPDYDTGPFGSARNKTGSARAANRQAYMNQLRRMSGMVDEMIAGGKLHPSRRNAAIHNLMTQKSAMNLGRIFRMDDDFDGWQDILKEYGYSPPDPKRNPYPKHHMKKKYQHLHRMPMFGQGSGGQFDDLLYKKFQGKNLHMDGIKPDMMKKGNRDLYDMLHLYPWLNPELYLDKYRDKVSGFARPFQGVDVNQFMYDRKNPPPRPVLSLPHLPSWGTPAADAKPPHSKSHGKGRRYGLGFMDLMFMADFAGIWDKVRSGSTYKNAPFFGGLSGGAVGEGFAAGMDGTKFNDFLGTMIDFNDNAEKNGRKKMGEGIGKIAFLMGKFWRLALSPWLMVPAAAIGAWLGAREIWRNTERGRQYREMLDYRKGAIATKEKVLDRQITNARELYEQIRQAVEDRNDAGDPNNNARKNFLDDFMERGWGAIWERAKEQYKVYRKTQDANNLLNLMADNVLTTEEMDKIQTMLWKMGVAKATPSAPEDHPAGGGKRQWNLEWMPGAHVTHRIPFVEIPQSSYDEGGYSGITGNGIPWTLVDGISYITDLLRDGPDNARRQWAMERSIHERAVPGSGGTAIIYAPLSSTVTANVDSIDNMLKFVDERVQKNLENYLRHMRDSSGNILGTPGDTPATPVDSPPVLPSLPDPIGPLSP